MKAVRKGMGLDTRSFEIGFDEKDVPSPEKAGPVSRRILLQGIPGGRGRCQDSSVQHGRSVRGNPWEEDGVKPGLTYSICFAKIRKGKA